MSFTFIIDIGKTNIKAQVLDGAGASCWSMKRANTVVSADPYPHFDTADIWQWLCETLRTAARSYEVTAINVSTHGACAVLLDEAGDLVLPVMDYESNLPEQVADEYALVRPGFADSLSPDLPAGLNLGRQLWWQRTRFPEAFARTATLLCYAQYWVWKLTGAKLSERTSLACHTDLWLPLQDDFSPLVDTLGLRQACPPLMPTYGVAGTITDAVVEQTRLSEKCRVYAGVHDSNASFARYLACAGALADNFTVVSTGTWFVTMARHADCRVLEETRDTLANVDVTGSPVACARFMGGREYAALCARLGAASEGAPTVEDLQAVVNSGAMALPAFAAAGPFNGCQGEQVGPAIPAALGSALATLYLALMVDYELDLLDVQGDVIFGSLSHRNPNLCGLLAALRPAQRIFLSGNEASTVLGAWCLTRWQSSPPAQMSQFDVANPLRLIGIEEYRAAWRTAVTQRQAC